VGEEYSPTRKINGEREERKGYAYSCMENAQRATKRRARCILVTSRMDGKLLSANSHFPEEHPAESVNSRYERRSLAKLCERKERKVKRTAGE